MANQDNYRNPSEKGKNSNREIKHPYNRRQDASGGKMPRMFDDPANEWQRTGETSDQHWWHSGTKQQQQFFSGETNYPYRENDWGRNQQGQAGIENLYPQEPASERQKQNFAEGSQYPYEGGYGAENPRAREGLERANEEEGPAESRRERPASWQNEVSRDGGFVAENLRERAAGQGGRLQGQPQASDRRQFQQDRIPGWVKNEQMQNSRQFPAGTNPRRDQFYVERQNQEANQIQNVMQNYDRNYRRYNEDRNEGYDRERSRVEGRSYEYARGGGGLRDRDYERVSFRHARDFNGGGEGRSRDYDSGYSQRNSRNHDRDIDRNRYDQPNEGRYHSTEADVPGRGYRSEREMNRHANNLEYGSRSYGESSQANRGDRNYGVSSSHRATGPYEDFERDVERYGIREDYRNRGRNTSYGSDYGRDRDYGRNRAGSGNRSFGSRPNEEAERHRRLSSRIQDHGLERSRSGNREPSGNRRDRAYNPNERY